MANKTLLAIPHAIRRSDRHPFNRTPSAVLNVLSLFRYWSLNSVRSSVDRPACPSVCLSFPSLPFWAFLIWLLLDFRCGGCCHAGAYDVFLCRDYLFFTTKFCQQLTDARSSVTTRSLGHYAHLVKTNWAFCWVFLIHGWVPFLFRLNAFFVGFQNSAVWQSFCCKLTTISARESAWLETSWTISRVCPNCQTWCVSVCLFVSCFSYQKHLG